MVGLAALSDATAIREAVAEFRNIGRDAFLDRYAFDKSQDYFLRIDDDLFDTKPIVASAYGHQYPERGALTNDQFSGGPNGAVGALRRLGFEVVTNAILFPPELGDAYPNRTAIKHRYGGDLVSGVTKFPGDTVLNVFSDVRGPYADDAPTLGSPFGYRGAGLAGPQRLDSPGNARLEKARISRSPVRFWYAALGEPFVFISWCVAVGRSWIVGVGADKQTRPEIEWMLDSVPSVNPLQWPASVVAAMDDAAVLFDNDPNVPEAKAAATYAELVDRVEQRGQGRRPSGVVRFDLPRSAAARRAVLIRAEGRCESLRCTGMPAEANRRGEAILDVDHIVDLALKGEDHPRNMVALCPNCHACKTRGARTATWRRELSNYAIAADTKARQQVLG